MSPTPGMGGCGRRPHAPTSPGSPGSGHCCLVSPVALTSPSCPGWEWETPCFCPGHNGHTSWIFCNKLPFLLLSLLSVSIPNILQFQHPLETAKEILGAGQDLLSLHWAFGRWALPKTGQGHPAVVASCSLHLPSFPTHRACGCPVVLFGPEREL